MRNDLNQAALKHAVMQVALLNFAWFFVEFAVARHIGSVSLFADSIDFLEDTCVNFLVLVALGWSASRRASVGTLLAILLLVPAAAAAWMAWRKFQSPLPPEVFALSATGAGALVVNLYCAWLLVRLRNVAGSLSRAAFLSARNDAFANLAIIAAGGATLFWPSAWPDLAVGIGILLMNLDAAREVLIAARGEADEAA
jgi:Co/Zn/Cd efflux system component